LSCCQSRGLISFREAEKGSTLHFSLISDLETSFIISRIHLCAHYTQKHTTAKKYNIYKGEKRAGAPQILIKTRLARVQPFFNFSLCYLGWKNFIADAAGSLPFICFKKMAYGVRFQILFYGPPKWASAPVKRCQAAK